jgi:hypothetical protein
VSYVSSDVEMGQPRHNHAWRGDGGGVHASVRLTDGIAATLFFDSAEDARAVAAACTEAAEALDRLADGGQP